ncbi:MAG TPA: TlpA disulfide reductase family protein [Bryobacteraceae bacterium]|nr:TlpA disulfide reductase family protein [Bryobacteraceae bacterium]
MLRRFLLVFILLGCFWLNPVWAKTPRPLAEVPIHTTTGQKISLKEYHAKVVLFVVFSTSCGDCVQTIQLMSKMQQDYGPFGFQAVAAAGDDNAKFQVALFMDRYRPSFPIGYLDQEEIIKLCDVPKGMRPFVPIALFIDQKNMVRFQYYGDNAFFKQEDHGMRSLVEGLLREAGAKIRFGEKK